MLQHWAVAEPVPLAVARSTYLAGQEARDKSLDVLANLVRRADRLSVARYLLTGHFGPTAETGRCVCIHTMLCVVYYLFSVSCAQP
jgi:hypothetical protein